MRKLALALTLCLALAAGGGAQISFPLAPQVAPEEVLAFLATLPVPEELKEPLAGEMLAGMSEGRLSPRIAMAFLQALSQLSPQEQAQGLEVMLSALMGEMIVDQLLNEALHGLRLASPWPQVLNILQLRLGLLSATQSVLSHHGLIPLRSAYSEAPPDLGCALLVLEVAWAIGDHLISGHSPADAAAMEELIHARLTRLRGTLLPVQLVDPLLAQLSPALVQEIVALALNPERR
jgi:hypothetical protein